MELKLTKKIFIVLGLVSCFSMQLSYAQNFTDIFQAPEEDMEAYLDNYIEPAMLSLANGMAGGWYNTAKAHKSLGFDLTVTVNVANIPTDERMFIFNNSEFKNLGAVSGNGTEFPTLVGGPTSEELSLTGFYNAPDGNRYEYTGIPNFSAPEGLDVSSLPFAGVPSPMIQLGIGIIKNTDLKIRYGKFNTTEDDLEYGLDLFGIGVMHDFKQWIPGLKHIPIDMSILVAYSRFKTTVGIDEDNSSFSAIGEAEMTANNTTIQALVSKKLSILTLYGGIGYNIVSSAFKVKGTIVNKELIEEGSLPSDQLYYTVTDPIDLTFDGGSTFRGTLGMRLKLAFFTIHSDYTFQKYNTFTAGIGLSIR